MSAILKGKTFMLASGEKKKEGREYFCLVRPCFVFGLFFWSLCSCKSGRAGELFESIGMLEDTCNTLKIQAPEVMKAT